MATYQHLLPGMSAQAAHDFAALIYPVDNTSTAEHDKPQVTAPDHHPSAPQRLPDR